MLALGPFGLRSIRCSPSAVLGYAGDPWASCQEVTGFGQKETSTVEQEEGEGFPCGLEREEPYRPDTVLQVSLLLGTLTSGPRWPHLCPLSPQPGLGNSL